MNKREIRKLASLRNQFDKIERLMIELSFKVAEMRDFDQESYTVWCDNTENYEWMTLVTDSQFQQNAQELETMFDYMHDVEKASV